MNPITNKKTVQSLIAAAALLFSVGAYALPDDDDNGSGCEVDCGYERGPDPTTASLEADNGPYSVNTSNVSRFASGFGGGTIHYPTGTSGTMGVIAVAPGYLSAESSIRWWGPRLASHGFVVITIATNTIYDQPGSRGDQLEAALDYVIDESESSRSPISGMVDSSRQAAMGWSMGGGGALRVATGDRLSAAIPLAPYNTSSRAFRDIQTPTLIFACENDSIARVRNHAEPFYEAIPNSTAKAFYEVARGSHTCANGDTRADHLLGKLGVSWMKRHLDKDERYNEFLCDSPTASNSRFSDVRDTCP